jgi:hypothetical protein
MFCAATFGISKSASCQLGSNCCPVGVKGVTPYVARVDRRMRWVRVIPFSKASSEVATAVDVALVTGVEALSESESEDEELELVPSLVPVDVPELVADDVPLLVVVVSNGSATEACFVALLRAISKVSTV